MKKIRIVYYLTTGLLTLLMLFSASMYFFNYEEVATMFTDFGYPTYIIYPYAVLKLLGLVVIWYPDFKSLKEWAYAGFFFAFILAFFAHYMIDDGEHYPAFMALFLLLLSYFSNKTLKKNNI